MNLSFAYRFLCPCALSLSVFLMSPSGFAQSTSPSFSSAWPFTGLSRAHGNYDGVLEIGSDDGNGAAPVLRRIRFQNFSYEGFAVEEVWEGRARKTESGLRFEFALKRWGYIRQVGSFTKPDAAGAPAVDVSADLDGDTLNWEVVGERDLLQPPPGKLGDMKIGEDVRAQPVGKPLDFITKAIVQSLAGRYYKDSLVERFKDRPEFKAAQHFIVSDQTNLEYYKSKPKTLRVVNQVLDPASLTEEQLRYSAYAFSLEEKATRYDQQTADVGFDEFGLLSIPLIDSEARVMGHHADLSTALWTGQYLVSQAYRYQLTQDPRALENIKRSVKGLMLLVDIDGVPSEFARSIRRAGTGLAGEQKDWVGGQGPYAGLEYNGRGNNDMIRGVILGFLFAYEALPADQEELKTAIGLRMRRLADVSTVVKTKETHQTFADGAAAIITGEEKYKTRYLKSLSSFKFKISTEIPIPKQIGSISDWSGNNLGLAKDILRIEIATRLQSPDLKDAIEQSRRDWKQVAAYRNVPHTFLLAQSLGQADAPRVSQSVAWLGEFPSEKPTKTIAFDHSQNPDFILSPYPSQPWKYAVDHKRLPSEGYQSLSSYAYFEATALTSNWTWRSSPFDFRGQTDPSRLLLGADYLFAYWLGRHSGAIQAGR